jgi:hypothetical protein
MIYYPFSYNATEAVNHKNYRSSLFRVSQFHYSTAESGSESSDIASRSASPKALGKVICMVGHSVRCGVLGGIRIIAKRHYTSFVVELTEEFRVRYPRYFHIRMSPSLDAVSAQAMYKDET